MLRHKLRIINWVLIFWTALAISALSINHSFAGISPTVTISTCVITPYSQELVVVGGDEKNLTAIHLGAGKCDDLSINIPAEGAYIYARAIRTHSLRRLQEHTFFEDAWDGLPIADFGKSGVTACVSRYAGEFRNFNKGGGCSTDEKAIGIGFVSPSVDKYALFLEDPHVCARRIPTCDETNGNVLLAWARDLERSLEISYRAWTDAGRTYGLIPTASGLVLKDNNGPFSRGLYVAQQQAPVTPLGSPVPANEGDMILAFNNEPVFDLDSYIMLAIAHGEKAGYEHPYSIEFERSGSAYSAQGYLVFHRDIYGSFFLNSDGTCKNRTGAMLSAALQEASFYTKPILACINYDRNHPSGYSRSECEFAVKQMTAAYRQYCRSITVPASLVGSVFMPGRKLAETPFRRFGFSRLGSALIVETLEETARAVITLPPGIKLEDNWNSIAQQVGFGMTVGFGIRLITISKVK